MERNKVRNVFRFTQGTSVPAFLSSAFNPEPGEIVVSCVCDPDLKPIIFCGMRIDISCLGEGWAALSGPGRANFQIAAARIIRNTQDKSKDAGE
jgi:hypothetical protein